MSSQQDALFDYDAELRRYQPHLRAEAGVRPDDRVLDIGCGAGQTTREAARAAAAGSALGIDISAARLPDARRLARAEGFDSGAWLITARRP
jgi:cyclopropane fatty-acyl-phospholipid synthase-like methyltransferase